MRAWRAGRNLLISGLAVALVFGPSFVGESVTPALAADGQGDGRALTIGVAQDGFKISRDFLVDIVPSKTHPGTVRFERDGGKKCLATDGGKNDYLDHRVQWTGCNGHSSKNWVLEPYNAGLSGEAIDDRVDDTLRVDNIVNPGESPRFIIRNYRYPKHCLYSYKNGLQNVAKQARGVTAFCSAKDTQTGGERYAPPAKSMQFAVMNDNQNGDEWEFLRRQMHAGAAAIFGRGQAHQFSGENLWVKPMSVEGDYVGLREKATVDGYFTPGAVEIDPTVEGAVVANTSSIDGCFDQKWWWGIDNTRGRTPVSQEITTGTQRTDEHGWALSVEAGAEYELGKGKYSVKVGGEFHKSWSTAKTAQQSMQMEVPAGLWGMVVVTTPTVTTLGNWKTGVALDRTWRFPGLSTVAMKDNRGGVTGTVAAFVQSHERKSCRAGAETSLEPGKSPEVQLPAGRLSPVVGDELAAHAPFIDPQDPLEPLDIRFQWYADQEPLSGQTLPTLQVTRAMIGKHLSFKAFESGGSMRYESSEFQSSQTASVLEEAPTQLSPVAMPEGIEGRELSYSLSGVPGLGDQLTVVDDQLPAGLTFDPLSGIISGAPGVPGFFVLKVEDQFGEEVDALLTVDAAPTVFPAATGMVVHLGNQLNIPLVTEAGTGATYDVDFFSSQGQPAPIPAGVVVAVNDQGVPSLSGTPSEEGEVTVRVTEQTPHHDPGDARPTTYELSLQIAAATEPAAGASGPAAVPEIAFTQVSDDSDDADSSGQIKVGSWASWQAAVSEAAEFGAVVRRKGIEQPVTWAEAVRTLDDEIEIDITPEDAGDYVLTVTASNERGTTVKSLDFTVFPADDSADPDGGSDGSGTDPSGGTGGEKTAEQNLALTGSAGSLVGILAAGIALFGAGIWLVGRNMLPKRATETQRGNDAG